MMGIGPLELVLVLVIGVILLAVAICVAATMLSKLERLHGPNFRPCAECGRQISKRAAACPRCGCPVNPET